MSKDAISHSIPVLIQETLRSLSIGELVRKNRLLLLAAPIIFPVAYSFAQINCPATTATQLQYLPLVCLVPFSVAANVPVGGNTVTPAIQQSAVPINGTIAAQLTQLPVPSGTSGTIFLIKEGVPQGQRFDDLGPILTDRPETIGNKHIYLGFTYQHFNFNSLDGSSLGALNFGYAAQDSSLPLTYYGSSANSVQFKFDQFVVTGGYGVSPTTDVTVSIPINSVSVSAKQTNIVEYTYNSSSTATMAGIPTGYTTGQPTSFLNESGSAKGVGDIKFGVKQLLYGEEKNGEKKGQYRNLVVAAGLALRVPTGDALNFLGSGAYGVDIYGLVSYRNRDSRFSPHFKLGRLWNGSSVLVNSNASGNSPLPGGMEYDAGTDIRISGRRLTLAVDVIGNQFVNGLSLKPSAITLNPTPTPANTTHAGGGGVPASLRNVLLPANDTYTSVNFSGGIKYNPTAKLLFYGNVLVQTNNVGLRSDPVPLVGVSYNFNLGKTKGD